MLKKDFQKKPKLVAVFAFRYDKELISDLKKNLSSFVNDYVIWNDSKNTDEWYNEGEIRNYLIQEAKNKGADWILCVDPDERFEKNAGKKIRKLIQTNEKYIYSFRFRELWDSPIKYRNDGLWGRKRKAILFPNLPRQIFMNLRVHSQWYPLNPDYIIIETDINLYHLKMINEQNREDRKNLYNRLDPNNEFQKIGYDYLTDTANIELVTIEKNKEYRPKYKNS